MDDILTLAAEADKVDSPRTAELASLREDYLEQKLVELMNLHKPQKRSGPVCYLSKKLESASIKAGQPKQKSQENTQHKGVSQYGVSSDTWVGHEERRVMAYLRREELAAVIANRAQSAQAIEEEKHTQKDGRESLKDKVSRTCRMSTYKATLVELAKIYGPEPVPAALLPPVPDELVLVDERQKQHDFRAKFGIPDPRPLNKPKLH
ncbi:hypothetical protein [Gloeobacter violaceus]|uniref:hypothetical protein n=1 Tax=Gloeobacter violaceus TaxID=33072 RepID=UPI0013E8BE44|nr:hypothetical protein [Gloeobacter violaceus]